MSQETVSRPWARQVDRQRERRQGTVSSPTVSDTVSDTAVSPAVSQVVSDTPVSGATRTVTVADVAAAAGERPARQDPAETTDYVGPPPFRVSFADAAQQLRFVSNPPGSLLDQIEYAREGAYTNRVNGPWRTANIVFAKYIAVAGLGLCYLIGWSLFTRLSRTLTCGPLYLLLFMLLNQFPVVAWLVPDALDFTTWWG